ncbi:hypothetical protein B0H10DRAFT_460906 [Mycena sp. CBHHK59/15]|nr:hypothetical protein B0H10DRAFT_460906 [Mycena sp. CBHHK59/15]
MAQRTVGPWTKAEDFLLIRAVSNFGEHDNWKTVAQAVPGRTNKACRKRWLHSLSPAVKKSAWTPSEDRLLVELYGTYGPKWSAIARQIRGRTDDACSKRYREALDPNLKKDEWTPDEDAKLMQVFARIGGKWGQVGQELRRSGLGCRNRWRMLERNRTKTLLGPPSASHTVFNDPQYMPGALLDTDPMPLTPLWPVYYPPEAYPSVLSEEPSQEQHSFREPTPQMPDSPEVPPFQFSSSSLSAALSDPPRTSLPLPPVAEEEVEHNPCDSPEPFASAPYSPAHNGMVYQPDTISPADLTLHRGYESLIDSLDKHAPSSRISNISSPPASSSSSPLWRSPLVSSTDSLPLLTAGRPPGPFDHTSLDTFFGPDVSSSSSSPMVPASSLSPADSPGPPSPIDLPPESLLFSPSPYYRTAPSKRQKKVRPRKPPKLLGESRLSSLLPLSTDPNMRAYACGRETCWCPNSEIGDVCFATSKELLEHSRTRHAGEPVGERPFRCALTGCGKSWKTLNGLQYHLQISTAHFRHAVSSNFTSTDDGDSPATLVLDPDVADRDNRTHICHHPQCFKAYKQPSGLRYHLQHGHPQELPAQLEVVPPTLARQMPKQTKKMRRKGPTEDT